MLKSKTTINFKDKTEVIKELEANLKNHFFEKSAVYQNTLLHNTKINFKENSANIEVTFSKKFYAIFVLMAVFLLFLPKESAFIWSSSIAVFVIFSLVMYFSLDYKMKTILDAIS